MKSSALRKKLKAFVGAVPTLFVLALGFLLSFVLALGAYRVIRNEDEMRFADLVENIAGPINSRLGRYENSLVQTRAFFIVSGGMVTREQFMSYAANMKLLERFPGAQGLGFTISLDPKVAQAKGGSFNFLGNSFQLWPIEPVRNEYHSIVFLYPDDWRNERAIGFDMASNPVRKLAMERARDTGEPALTAKVTLVQETEVATQPGFLLYVPHFKPNAPTDTVEQRRQALVGFIYGAFRAYDYMNSIIPSGVDDVDYQLYSESVDQENLLFDSKTITDENPDFQTTKVLSLGQQNFVLAAQSSPTFVSPSRRYFPYFVFLLGSAVTLLIWFVISRLRRTAAIERRAKETVQTLNKINQTVSAELDLDKLVQQITDAATQVSKAQFGALFYSAISAEGQSYTLYTLSGAPKEAFSKFPLPRNTGVFHPTFANQGVVRSDDITKDPRFGKNPPHNGMPKGHLPVRSYLAVSVVSRTGEIIGGLFFGHSDVGVFSEREEELVVGLAAQAAIAIDNANLYRSAQDAIRARDEFLSVCSHELKTPLTSLQLEAQINKRILRRKGDSAVTAEMFKSMIETTEQQTASLTRLVDDMLDIGRISIGRIRLNPDRTTLQSVLESCEHQMRPIYEAQHVGLTFEVPKQTVEILWDTQRVIQILTNLLINALKYGDKKPVKLSAETLGPHVIISVEDQGSGIAKDHQERIFSRFERAARDPNVKGLGLGLFISRKIAEAHHGTVKLESEVGRGSKFILTIPLHPLFESPKLEVQH